MRVVMCPKAPNLEDFDSTADVTIQNRDVTASNRHLRPSELSQNQASGPPETLEIHYETFLPSNKELEYRAREYVTNPRYGHLYEVREMRPKPSPKDNRVISWFWENQFQLWRQEMDSAYHNQLLVNQRRQVAATVVQRHFRGWRTRMRLSRLKRRALLELGRPWSKVVQDLRQLVSRVQARHGVMRTGSRFTLSDLEEYVDRRQKYERTFEKMAPDGKLSRDQLEAFVNECEHYPTEGELNDAFNSVFKGIFFFFPTHSHPPGSGSTAEVVFVLDCSTSVDAISFNDQMTFVKDVVRCLHVAPHRVRVGVVPYNTDVFQSFGLLQHSSGREVIEAVGKFSHSRTLVSNLATELTYFENTS
ncbi:hypothetical protein C0Q70_18037 [Pomacea canaliculata]|uniref:VWFA domain-containing protein n=1 Tax=Pomacea canaliculata TaxID=400727 RepID=A0A2T7NM41_POMCA|nr:hypothetical protein C0Q70_18037 [Pomacea canaliculata]